MEFAWKYAEPLLSGLRIPDYGSEKSWTQWYEQVWAHMAKAGLTEVESPLDLTRIRLRIAALCWFSLDFVAASQRDEYANTFYWSDWIKSLGIEPLSALATAIDEREMREVLKEHLDCAGFEFEEDEDEGIIVNDGELWEELPNKIVAVAAANQRPDVVHALTAGFGGKPEMFLGLYLACQDINRLIDEKESEPREELCDLEEQLQHELNRQSEKEESKSLTSDDKINTMRREIESFKNMLEPESLHAMVIDEMTNEAFLVVRYFSYESDFERMNGLNWCMEGCPIQSWGED